MANLTVGQVLEFVMVCHDELQFSINVRHYRVSAVSATPPTDTDALNELDTQFSNAMKAILSENADYWGSKLQIIRPTKLAFVVNLGSRDPGLFAGDLIPGQVAGVIKIRTGQIGRSKRGRMYVPFVSEDANDQDGNPNAAYLTAANGMANLIDDTINVTAGANTATLIPVVFSRKLLTTEDVTSAVARTQWGTQRRRSSINRPDADPLAV